MVDDITKQLMVVVYVLTGDIGVRVWGERCRAVNSKLVLAGMWPAQAEAQHSEIGIISVKYLQLWSMQIDRVLYQATSIYLRIFDMTHLRCYTQWDWCPRWLQRVDYAGVAARISILREGGQTSPWELPLNISSPVLSWDNIFGTNSPSSPGLSEEFLSNVSIWSVEHFLENNNHKIITDQLQTQSGAGSAGRYLSSLETVSSDM